MRTITTMNAFHKAVVKKHFAVAKVFISRGKLYMTN